MPSMYIISSRRGFTDADSFADKDQLGLVDSPTRARRATIEELCDHVAGRRTLLLIHGYNNAFRDIWDSYQTIFDRGSAFFERTFGYVWPGGDAKWEWWQAKHSSGRAAERLTQHLETLGRAATELDIMGHSLGSRVALEAVCQLPAATVHNLYLLAPSVDNECLQPGEQYFCATQLVGNRVFVFYDTEDLVLRTAFRVSELDNALGQSGPQDPNKTPASVTAVNCRYAVQGHADYRDTAALYRFIANHADSHFDAPQFERL